MKKSTKTGIFFLMIILIFFGMGFLMDFIPEKYSTTNLSMLLGQMSIAVPLLIYLAVTKGKPLKDVRHEKIKIEEIIIIVIFAWVCMPVSSFLNVVTMLFSDNMVAGSITDLSGNLFIVNVVMIAVLPAVLEELTYRGMFFYGLRGYGVVASAVVSGFLFGINHMNINQFAYAFLLGIVFALMDEVSDSIFASMIMHFVFNFNTVCSIEMLKLMPILEKMQDNPEYQQYMDKSGEIATNLSGYSTNMKIAMLAGFGIAAVIAVIVNFYIFRWYAKRIGRWQHICECFRDFRHGFAKTEQGHIISVPTVLGILICIFVMLINIL